MPKHVVVDGSNIATEGRSMPSLRQLNDAVLSFIEEHPTDLVTVVVDATFGHRIDAKEVAEFDEAIANNELVCPPAGAVGRGDAFVLSIANKVGATILSNDSFQEFHGDYSWLFDDGRLLGGKPVLHVGWVFVPRTPVRGPISRKAVKAKKGKAAERSPRASSMASLPMPVPTSPPPRRGRRGDDRAGTADPDVRRSGPVAASAVASAPASSNGRRASAKPQAVKHADAPTPAKAAFVNEPLPFLAFVGGHPVGTIVEGTIDSYSSHGAYLVADGARCYVPLRYMASPAPRAARDVLKLGGTYSFVVASFNAGRRSIDVAIAGFEPAEVTEAMATAVSSSARKRRTGRKDAAGSVAAAEVAADAAAAGSGAADTVDDAGEARRPSRRGRGGHVGGRLVADTTSAPGVTPAEPEVPAPAVKRVSRRRGGDLGTGVATGAPSAPSTPSPDETAPAAPTRVTTGRKAPAKAKAKPKATKTSAAPAPVSSVVAPSPSAPVRTPAAASTRKPSATKAAAKPATPPTSTAAKAPAAKSAAAKAPAAKSPAAKSPAAKASPPNSSAPRSPAVKSLPKKAAPKAPAPGTPPKAPAKKQGVTKAPEARTTKATTPAASNVLAGPVRAALARATGRKAAPSATTATLDKATKKAASPAKASKSAKRAR